jgi:hypothetical protein
MSQCPLHPETLQPCHLCGIARVRAALAVAPRGPARTPEPVSPVHDLAKARARTGRTNAKEKP